MLRDDSEFDLLECRLVQSEDLPVYRHVLVEAPLDHRGHPKPLYYAENRSRFAAWEDRIVHIVAEDLPTAEQAADPWVREAAQRDATAAALGGVTGDDWLIIADLDEILNARAIEYIQAGQRGILELTVCIFAVDWLWGQMKCTPVMPAAFLGKYGSVHEARRQPWHEGPVLPGGGHHLTWLGGQDKVRAKLAAYPHTEVEPGVLAALENDAFIRQGTNPFRPYMGWGPEMLTPADVDETWPKYIYNRVTGKKPCAPPEWFRPR
jgi:hypothetical protein